MISNMKKKNGKFKGAPAKNKNLCADAMTCIECIITLAVIEDNHIKAMQTYSK